MAHEASLVQALLSPRARGGTPSVPVPGLAALDDAAVLRADAFGGHPVAVSTDALEEGVHFRLEWQSWTDLAWRLLAVNLSDLAAMAAQPVGYLLAVAWPSRLGEHEARRLGEALLTAEAAARLPLLGGDTDVREGPLRLTATILGSCAPPGPILRRGARPGDALWVTGSLGGAAAAVERLLELPREADSQPLAPGQPPSGHDWSQPEWQSALAAFRRPAPRVDLARKLAPRAHALIDLSDGLLPDLRQVARMSGVAASLSQQCLPVHAAARLRPDPLQLALEGGEDYELLVAGPQDLGETFPSLIRVGSVMTGEPGSVRIEP